MAHRAATRDDQLMRRSEVAASPGVVVAMWLSLSLAITLLLPGGDDLMGFGAFAFGGAIAWFFGRREQQRKEDFAIGRMTRSNRVAVHRAVATGVAPGDPWLHEAALDLARFRAANTVRANTFWPNTLVCVLLAVSVFYAVTDPSLEHALSVVMSGVALALFTADLPLRQRKVARLEQAIEQLARAAHA
jgi:membrane associated rhomboid family serine protease